MKTINVSLIFFLILISFASCRKDSLTTEITPIPTEPEINIETTLNGFITDRNGDVIAGAEVSVLNASTETNEFGFFEITGLVNENFAVIKVKKQGYFDQFESLVPSKNATSKTRIQMTEKGSPEIFSANSGGEITIGQNSSVKFQANSFVDEQENNYSGNVYVYSFYIDPTDPEIDQIMPGNLMARNTNDELRVLESYGMMNVVLEGDAGQKLNINKSATLTTEVPNSILSSAPDEIPLWYFDEEKGLWMEEGNAILENGKYIGTVEHFTFWNCDVPSRMTFIEGVVEHNLSSYLSLQVRITNLNSNNSFSSYINDKGQFDGGVPKDVPLLLEILDICGNTIFSQNIGPFSVDEVDLGTFDVSGLVDIAEVTGTLVDCNLNPISNGQIYFKFPNSSHTQLYNTDADGNFTTIISTCGLSEIEIIGIDLQNVIIGTPQIFTINSVMTVGSIIACGNNYVEGVILTIDGVTRLIPDMTFHKITDVPNVIQYQFVFKDYEFGEAVQYFWRFNDNNENLNNPDWSFQHSYTLPNNTNNHEGYKITNLDDTNITVLQEANVPGDQMTIKVENCTIEKTTFDWNGSNITVTNHANCTVILTGKII